MAEKSRQGINIRVCTKAPLLGEKAVPLLDNVGKREEEDLGVLVIQLSEANKCAIVPKRAL